MASLHKQIDSHHIHGGWLFKKGVINRAWKKRYFVLFDDRTISYFEKEKHSKSRNKAKGAIHLTQIQRVELVQYEDPNVTASMPHFNQIVTNRTHSVNPKDKRKLKENGMKQQNYLHRATLAYLRQHTNPMKSNAKMKSNIKTLSKAKTTMPFRGNRNRAMSPSFTTEDMDAIFKFKQQQQAEAKEEEEEEKAMTRENKNLNSASLNVDVKSITPKRIRLHTVGNEMLCSPSGASPNLVKHDDDDIDKDKDKDNENDAKFGLRQSRSVSTDGSDHESDVDELTFHAAQQQKRQRNRSSSAVGIPVQQQVTPQHYKTITPLDDCDAAVTLSVVVVKKQPLKKAQSQSTLFIPSNDRRTQQPKQQSLVPSFEDDKKYTSEDGEHEDDEETAFLDDDDPTFGDFRRMRSSDKTGKQRLSSLPKPPPRNSLTRSASKPSTNGRPHSKTHSSAISADFGSALQQQIVLSEHDEHEEEEKAASSAVDDAALGTDAKNHLAPLDTQQLQVQHKQQQLQQPSPKKKKQENRDIIVSDHIKKLHREQHRDSSRSQLDSPLTPHDSHGKNSVYQKILHEQHSDLTADRYFSFALIEPTRNWILSAETERECSQWMNIFNKLVQGKTAYSGYLVKRGKNVKSWKKRWFVLFENKLLNYYQHSNITEKGCLIGDIDMRHAMWMRICHANEFKLNVADFFDVDEQQSSSKRSVLSSRNKSNTINVAPSSIGGIIAKTQRQQPPQPPPPPPPQQQQQQQLNDRNGSSRLHYKSFSWQTKKNKGDSGSSNIFFEIATPNRTWVLGARNMTIRNTWYAQIRDVFSDKLILKIYFDSPCNVEVVHAQQNLKQRYAALLKGWLIIFRDKNKLNDVRQMTFFQENIFRDYVRNKNCICIPLKEAHIEKCTEQQHLLSFQLKIQERCWYFQVDSEEILDKWMHLLSRSHRDNVDVSQIEMSYSNLPT